MKQLLRVLLAAIALAVAASAQAEPVPYGNNPSAGKFYDVRGFKMYCEEYGTGMPLLMIHGNGGSIQAFAHNIPYFAAKYRVIAADSRSQGKSKDPGPVLTFEMMADDEAALLDTLHIQAAYVLGWSDGGIVALALAMRHPDKVIKLASTGANVQSDASANTTLTKIKFGRPTKKETNGSFLGSTWNSPTFRSTRFRLSAAPASLSAATTI